MDKHAGFIKHLRQVFLQELAEHLAQLELTVLQLATLPQLAYDNSLKQLFRTAHTLKGASRVALYPEIEHIADSLETLLSGCNKDDVQPLLLKSDVLLQIIDVLKEITTKEPTDQLTETDSEALTRLSTELLQSAAAGEVEVANLKTTNTPEQQLATSEFTVTQLSQHPIEKAATHLQPELSNTVKVRGSVLSQLLHLHSEMLSAQQRLQAGFKQLQYWRHDHHGWLYSQQNNQVAELKKILASLQKEQKQLNQILLPLSERILQTGMAPFALACDALQRAVHDLCAATGKKAQLQIFGQSTEFDRFIIDALKDPLLHLIRNAIDHGIETPEQRLRLNKPVQGKVLISASLRHGGVCVSVSDDGSGIDLSSIRAQLPPEDANKSDEELVQKILLPGFTTAQKLTSVSGRGIGMDVVSDTVRRLRGQVQINNNPGLGLEVQLHLPINLSVLFALEVSCSGQIFYLDAQTVVSMHRIKKEQLLQQDGNWVLPQSNLPLAVFSLATLLGLDVREWPEHTRLPLVHLTDGQDHIGILVDALVNEQQIAVKPLGPRFANARLFSGGSLQADGQVALILHSGNLVQHALSNTSDNTHWKSTDTTQAPGKKRLLVAEDSITTRTLLKGMLELEGFDVTLAEDGMHAWQKLQREHYDLVISDVEMPLMNGFELCENARKSTRCKHTPIILVTALKTDEDKLKGMQAGANAYIVKSNFEQTELLKAINQLL